MASPFRRTRAPSREAEEDPEHPRYINPQLLAHDDLRNRQYNTVPPARPQNDMNEEVADLEQLSEREEEEEPIQSNGSDQALDQDIDEDSESSSASASEESSSLDLSPSPSPSPPPPAPYESPSEGHTTSSESPEPSPLPRPQAPAPTPTPAPTTASRVKTDPVYGCDLCGAFESRRLTNTRYLIARNHENMQRHIEENHGNDPNYTGNWGDHVERVRDEPRPTR